MKTANEHRNTAGFEALTGLAAEQLRVHGGIGSQKLAEAPATLPAVAYETLGAASAFAARVMELADRLCGPVPSSGEEAAGHRGDTGEFGRLRVVMSDTREAIADAHSALNRIERELVG